jgi:hypothetical protein
MPSKRIPPSHSLALLSSLHPIPTMEAEVRPPVPLSPSSTSSFPAFLTSIYRALHAYPFTSDLDFQAGITSLTSDPTLSPNELSSTIFQAQCFYFARRYDLPPIDPADYQRWLSADQDQGNTVSVTDTHEQPFQAEDSAAPQPQSHIAAQPLGQPAPSSTISPSSQPPPLDPPAGPPYPASFESIVDLITRNQPIPGIEEIPDTILDASLSAPNQTARRKKPWETDEALQDVEPVLGDAMADEQGKPTGVVGILQPIKKLEDGEGTNPGALQMEDGKEGDTATIEKPE